MGALFFIVVVMIQVIAAFIPAGPIEIAAGYCFGILPGAIICDIGMTLGGIIVFLLVRRFGMAFIEIFISKDVLSYAVGLTDLSPASWIMIISIARFPSILLTVLSGDALEDERYGLFIIVLIFAAVLAGIGTLVYRSWTAKQNTEREGSNGKQFEQKTD